MLAKRAYHEILSLILFSSTQRSARNIQSKRFQSVDPRVWRLIGFSTLFDGGPVLGLQSISILFSPRLCSNPTSPPLSSTILYYVLKSLFLRVCVGWLVGWQGHGCFKRVFACLFVRLLACIDGSQVKKKYRRCLPYKTTLYFCVPAPSYACINNYSHQD